MPSLITVKHQKSLELPHVAEERTERLVPIFRSVFPDSPVCMRVCKRADWAGPQSRALGCKKPLSGKSILLSLKGFRIRKFKPRCKHLQTEVDFLSLCTWNECWKGKAILILSWQCLSLLPKAEIIISSVVTQLLRGVIHLILLYNHSTGFYFCCYWNGKCT